MTKIKMQDQTPTRVIPFGGHSRNYTLDTKTMTTAPDSTVGERVRRAREAEGLTQEQLAAKAGVTQNTISNLERGFTSTSRELPAIARALRRNLAWLTRGDGPELQETLRATERASVLESIAAGPHDPLADPGATLRWLPVTGALVPSPVEQCVEYAPLDTGERVAAVTSDTRAFAVRVIGDLLAPRYQHGEVLVLEPGHAPQPGDEVLVRLADNPIVYVKRMLYWRLSRLHLGSINEPTAPEIVLPQPAVERTYYVAGSVRPRHTRMG